MGVAEGEGTEKFLMEKTKHIPSEFNPTVVTALLSTALTTLSAQLNSSGFKKDWSPPSLARR